MARESVSPTTSPVLVLTGPTASGKTEISLQIAREMNAEIVSADSRQLYRYLDIGTAKPLPSERMDIPHYGFDVADPYERYSAGRFASEARGWIQEVLSRGKPVVVVGGSGLYIEALMEGFYGGEDVSDYEVRRELNLRAKREGLEALYEELCELDPAYAEKISRGDKQRIFRALEVVFVSGKPFSDLHGRERDKAPFTAYWVALDLPREVLYGRINRRVEAMMDRGLLREVRDLLDRGYREANALKSVGYMEIIDLLDGKFPDIETAVDAIQKNTRQFAKRQLTWFRRYEQLLWIAGNRPPGITAEEILALWHPAV